MNCPVCDGPLQQQTVNICACDDLPAVIVRNVPAMVCTRCQEKVLSQEVIDVFTRIRKGKAPPASREYSRVYDYQTVVSYKTAAHNERWVLEAAVTRGGTGTHLDRSRYHLST